MPVDFVGREVEVTLSEEKTPVPLAFRLGSREFKIAEQIASWQEGGFAGPRRGRDWRQQQERRYYRVRTEEGEVYELYADWSPRRRQRKGGEQTVRWYLHRHISAATLEEAEEPGTPGE
jgi:hypothetical protein